MSQPPRVLGSSGAIDLTNADWQGRLTVMMITLRPTLVIVDGLGSASRGAENQIIAVDALFGILNGLAARHQCAILLIHHLPKREAAPNWPPRASMLN